MGNHPCCERRDGVRTFAQPRCENGPRLLGNSPSYNRSATGWSLADDATARLAALAWKALTTGVDGMEAQVEELPEGRGLRPKGVCQLAGNRHGRIAIDELRERAEGRRPGNGRRRGGRKLGGRLGHLLGAPEETYGLETATLAV